MKQKGRRFSCTYAVALRNDPGLDLPALARYMSALAVAGCEVLILDGAPRENLESRRRVLRWVGRHVCVAIHSDSDVLLAAADLASCEKVIVAGAETRYTLSDIVSVCDLLSRHEVVEPEEYIDPLTWWAGLDAGRMLLHRGVDQPQPQRGTYGFRRSAIRSMRGIEEHLILAAAHVHEARNVFVRRQTAPLPAWWSQRARDAAIDLSSPARSVFFLGFVPLLIVLALAGGLQIASGYAGILAFASVALAVRGRVGAGKFFPAHACVFAPLWIAERSLTVYWALFARLRGAAAHPVGSPDAASHRTDPPSYSVHSSRD
jgi:hypothetical protein